MLGMCRNQHISATRRASATKTLIFIPRADFTLTQVLTRTLQERYRRLQGRSSPVWPTLNTSESG